MTPDERDELLADALGGELDDLGLERLDAARRADPTFAAEHDALERALAMVRDLPGPGKSTMRQPERRRWPRTALRYAAAIAVAFVAGWIVRGAPAPSEPELDEAVVSNDVQQDVDAWRERAGTAWSRQAGRSGLARSLITIAEAGR